MKPVNRYDKMVTPLEECMSEIYDFIKKSMESNIPISDYELFNHFKDKFEKSTIENALSILGDNYEISTKEMYIKFYVTDNELGKNFVNQLKKKNALFNFWPSLALAFMLTFGLWLVILHVYPQEEAFNNGLIWGLISLFFVSLGTILYLTKWIYRITLKFGEYKSRVIKTTIFIIAVPLIGIITYYSTRNVEIVIAVLTALMIAIELYRYL